MFKKLSTNNFFILFITTFISTLSIASLWLTDTYLESKKELAELTQNYIHTQKVLLQEKVHHAVVELEQMNALAKKMSNQKDMVRVQEEMLKKIRAMRFGKDGYIFILDENGTVVAQPIKPELEGKNLLQLKDANGVLFVAKLVEMAKKHKKGFMSYMWYQPSTKKTAEKLAYVEYVEGVHQIVGSGIYMNTVNGMIQHKEVLLKEKMQEKMVEFVTLFFLVLLVISYFLYKQYTRLNNSFKQFHTVLNESHKTLQLISIEKIDFVEFQSLAKSFNAMIRVVQNNLDNLDKILEEKTCALQEQRDVFESLYQKSTDAILLIQDGKFIDCNESALKILQYDSKDVLFGKNPSNLSPDYQPDGKSSSKKAKEMIQIAMEKGSHSFEWVHTKASGETFWVEVVLTKIVQNNHDILHVVWRDISDRKRTEEELRELTQTLQERIKDEVEKNRQKDQMMFQQTKLAQMGEMISMIAHQWRQPLAAISATSGDLIMKIMLDACDKIYFDKKLKKIEKLSLHLSKTIDDFRNFYKKDKQKTTVKFSDVINNALNIVSVSLQNKNITLKTDFTCQKEIETYPNELQQVILNLLKNAEDVLIDKSVKNPYIHIRTYDHENYSYFVVTDNGGGIEETIMDKLFEPYFSTKLQKDGTGLGLYISKIIIEEHCDGKLIVSNTKEGAKFTIMLPVIKSNENEGV